MAEKTTTTISSARCQLKTKLHKNRTKHKNRHRKLEEKQTKQTWRNYHITKNPQKNTSEYDQELPQSQTIYQPVKPEEDTLKRRQTERNIKHEHNKQSFSDNISKL